MTTFSAFRTVQFYLKNPFGFHRKIHLTTIHHHTVWSIPSSTERPPIFKTPESLVIFQMNVQFLSFEPFNFVYYTRWVFLMKTVQFETRLHSFIHAKRPVESPRTVYFNLWPFTLTNGRPLWPMTVRFRLDPKITQLTLTNVFIFRSNFRRCGFPVTSNHKKVHF